MASGWIAVEQLTISHEEVYKDPKVGIRTEGSG